MPTSEMDQPFEAEYPGTCSKCDSYFPARTLIVYAGNGWAHAGECPDPTQASQDVCPTCFTELPVSGVCGVCDGD